MRRDVIHETGRAEEVPPRPRKVRTSDCRNCLLLKSLISAGVSKATMEAICDRMWLNRVRRRQILFTEGNQATRLFAIRAGKVKLAKVDTGGNEHIVGVLESGDLFGLEAVFDSAYATGAEALTDSELCSASGEDLTEVMNNVPRMAIDLVGYLHRRLLQTLACQANRGVSGARAKVAAYLLQDLRDDGCGSVIPRELTLRELGAVLGLAPETVSRTLGVLRAERIINLESSAIVINDPAALRQAATI